MAYDPEELRVVAKTWREYIAQMKDSGMVFAWMWQTLATEDARTYFKRVAKALMAMTILQIALPRILSAAFDGALLDSDRLVSIGVGGFLLTMLAKGGVSYWHDVSREWILGLTNAALDSEITNRFFEKSLGQHVDQNARLNHEMMSTGRERVLNTQGIIFFEATYATASLLFAYGFIWFISPIAGWILTAIILMHLIWMLHLNQKVFEVCTPLDIAFRKRKRYWVERLKNVERVKVCAMEAAEAQHTATWFDELIGRDRTFWTWFIKHVGFREAFGAFGLAGIIWYGTHLVRSHVWAIGMLYPLIAWSSQVVENLWRIGHLERQLNYNMPAIRAMVEALAIAPSVTVPQNPIVMDGYTSIAVEFKNVTHAYPLDTADDEEKDEESGMAPAPGIPVLKGVSFKVGSGEKVALIGSSGAGKSTVMKLLMRFMDPESGTIYVNGHDLRVLDLKSWMRKVGYIAQQAQLFDGTLRSNLTYALSPEEKIAWDDARLWKLMRRLRIDFGKRLHQGLDTLVGDHGVRLSGGQGQRVMIGAAAIKNPPFFIIDEATSHLDSATEAEVHEGLKLALGDKVGALIIAHRLSTVRDLCDRFIVLRDPNTLTNGEPQIEAVGSSFEELYNTSPTFRRLADAQDLVICKAVAQR